MKKNYWKPKRSNTTNGTGNPPNQQDAPPNPALRKHATDLMEQPRTASGELLFGESISAYNLKWCKLRDWLRQQFAAWEDLVIVEDQVRVFPLS